MRTGRCSGPLLLQRFYYRQMMYVVLFRAVMGAVQGKPVGWRGVEPEVPAPVAQTEFRARITFCEADGDCEPRVGPQPPPAV